jgi:hypothetical protein
MSILTAIKMFEVKPQQYIPNIVEFLSKRGIASKKKKTEPTPIDKEAQEMYNSLNQAKKEMYIASKNFEFAQEQELTDYFSYQIKAAQIKYQYLLKRIKEQNKNYSDFNCAHIMDELDNYLRK